jgi:hypothetical protein
MHPPADPFRAGQGLGAGDLARRQQVPADLATFEALQAM